MGFSRGDFLSPRDLLRRPRGRRLAVNGRGRPLRRGVGRRKRHHALRSPGAIERPDQIEVVTRRFTVACLDRVEDRFDAIDGGKNERDGFARDRQAVAELRHQAFGCVRQRLEPRQAEKAARSLDAVHQAKNVAENLAVVGLLLEAHEFRVHAIETLVGLGQELTQQVVHLRHLFTQAFAGPPFGGPQKGRAPIRRRSRGARSLIGECVA